MPSVSPADFNWRVMMISSLLGVRLPVGWLWATMMAVALSVSGSA